MKKRWRSLSHPIMLGSLRLDHNIILSPMAGVTDAPFLKLCAQGGSALMSGEMVSALAIKHQNAKTLRMLRFSADTHPVSWQIFGADPETMAEAAKKIDDLGADLIDINAGCPAPKITKTHSGAALLKDEKRFADILSAVVRSVKIPVTVKIRIGLRENERLAPALARLAENCGIAGVIVHARPASRRHFGCPDWEGLSQVVESVKIPVIGNGGVTAPEDAETFLKISKCSGVSIGRGAIGDPGIFKRIRHYLKTGKRLPAPGFSEKLETLRRHVLLAAEHYGERAGLLRLRKIVPYYVKGLPNAAAFRARANKISRVADWTQLLDETHGISLVERRD